MKATDQRAGRLDGRVDAMEFESNGNDFLSSRGEGEPLSGLIHKMNFRPYPDATWAFQDASDATSSVSTLSSDREE